MTGKNDRNGEIVYFPVRPDNGLLQAILDLTQDCIMLADADTSLVVYANRACERLYGYAAEQLIGLPVAALDAAGAAAATRLQRRVVAKHPRVHRVETVHVRRDGRHLPVEMMVTLAILNGRRYFLYHTRDISRQKRMEGKVSRLIKRLSQQAYLDYLTGVYNRAYLYQLYLPRLLGRSAAILLADLDHFKDINDRYGHQIGDEVLRGVSQALKARLRPQDALIRFGGEEFLIILPGLAPTSVAAVAERLRAAVAEQAYHTRAGELCCTMSLGATYGHIAAGSCLDMLIRLADDTLYQAKQTRNTWLLRPMPLNLNLPWDARTSASPSPPALGTPPSAP